MSTKIGIVSVMLVIAVWIWLSITMEAITLITGFTAVSFGIQGLVIGWIGIGGWALNIFFGIVIVPRAYYVELKRSH